MAAGAEDPDTSVRENCCFLCKERCLPRDKIKVFGRSSLEISALIARATKVDLSVYVASDKEKVVICNSKCYKRLVKYQNAVRKLDAIVGEILRDFQGRGLARGKRLANQQERAPDANKRIKLEDTVTSSSASPRETSQQAPSALQIGGKSNICTQPIVHVVYAAASSINLASKPGISVTTLARPSPIFTGANSVNTTTKPGISVTTLAGPSPTFASANSLNLASKPGISVTTLAGPSPTFASANSLNLASKPGISVTTLAGPSPTFASANGLNVASKPGISVTTLGGPSPIFAGANSLNLASKPGISVTTLAGPSPTFASANSINTATKPGILVNILAGPSPIFAGANSVNTSTKPGISVTTLAGPSPTFASANSVNTATKPGISVTTLAGPSPIFASANCVNTATKPGISVATFTRPSPVFVTNIPGYQASSGGLIQTPLRSFSAGQVLTKLPLWTQKPSSQKQDLPTTEKQEIKVRICVGYPSKTVRKELKSELHVLAKAMVDGTHNRIAGAVLKIDGVKEIVIEKVIKLMTLQVNDLCSMHRPSMLRATSRNTNDKASNFDYKEMCSEWKERAPIFHAFLTACAAIKNSRKKNTPECLPGVAVAGTVLLKQRNMQMNAGFAKILGFLIRSKSLEKLADLSNKIQRIEIMMSILEAKLASIPGLEDVTVSTPAPSQPSGAAAASAAGSAPPPASDVAQPAGEAQGPHPPPAEEPAPEPEKPTMTVAKDPRYAKYFQMVKVGVPIMAIAPKMKAEGLDPSYLENPDAPAPEGAPPPPGQSDSDEDMSSTSSFSDED